MKQTGTASLTHPSIGVLLLLKLRLNEHRSTDIFEVLDTVAALGLWDQNIENVETSTVGESGRRVLVLGRS